MAGALSSTPDSFDTVIVGAGVAGLAVARRLIDHGHSVVVLEARGRVGGRLESRQVADGGRVDLGATWFWPGEHRVAALVEELGVQTHDQYITGDAMYDGPDGCQRLDGNPLDVPAFRFTDGADSLTDALGAQLPPGTIRLDQPVARIDATSTDLAADTETGRFHGRTAVIALPPAVAVEHIEFTPLLPDPLTRLARTTPVWMASTTKVVIVYTEPFWRGIGLAGAGFSHRGPLSEIHDMTGRSGSTAALFGFASSQTDIEPGAVVEQLVRMFGEAAADPISIHVRDWSDDAATAPTGAAEQSGYQLFGHPMYRAPFFDGRAIWASTETGTSSPGHIEGALEAAEHASAVIQAALSERASAIRGSSS